MYSLIIDHTGMREPHWHPITTELGYVDRRYACMTILDPDGSTDTYALGPGDMYYIPAAYPPQIEVRPGSGDEIHFCIFFNQPAPEDVGYKDSATAIPHEAMAATLGVKRSELPDLESADQDPLIIGRINDFEPVKAWMKSVAIREPRVMPIIIPQSLS